MISAQILSKVLITKDASIITDNNLTVDHFLDYEPEFEFIMNHLKEYGNVPDLETIMDKFEDFELITVEETDKYLIDKIEEELLFSELVPLVQQTALYLKTNANDAVEYLLSQRDKLIDFGRPVGVDIFKSIDDRFGKLKEKLGNPDTWFIKTGFPELDNSIFGWNRTRDFVVLGARTGQGKSWVLTKCLASAFQQGYKVGMISPEMSVEDIGYRADTLMEGFSNTGLMWGQADKIDVAAYEKYVEKMRGMEGFIVATPQDFRRAITITKLQSFITKNKLDILGIDGITYLQDERAHRNDNKATMLKNISQDLISLSLELGVPIIVSAQINRLGAVKDPTGTPELETVSESDGITHNATKIITLRSQTNSMEFGVKKHRDGPTNGTFVYRWNADIGEFVYTSSVDDDQPDEIKEETARRDRTHETGRKKAPF